MEEEFHIPTEVLNDANAAALGEAWIGAAKGKKMWSLSRLEQV